MTPFEFYTWIDQPPDKVFVFIDCPEYYPKWQEGVIEAGGDPRGLIGVGTTGWQVRTLFGRQVKMKFEITAFEQNHLKAFRAISGPTKMEGTYLVEPVDGGAQFTARFTSEPNGFLKLLEPLINKKIKGQWDTSLVRLKQYLETEVVPV